MKSNFNDFKRFVENQQRKQNSTGLDDFDGLSPDKMHNILYSTFQKDGLIRLNPDISAESINKIPIFRLVKHFMRILEREKQIKLTQAEYMPPKYVKELYENTTLKDDAVERGIVKLVGEKDVIIIFVARILAKLCGYTKLRNNIITLTKAGEQALTDDRELYFVLMAALISKYNWGFESVRQDDGFIQRSAGYTLYLLKKYGNDYRESRYYYNKFFKAFPASMDAFDFDPDPKYKTMSHWWAYRNRIFQTYLTYTGAVEYEIIYNKEEHTETDQVRKTKLFNEIFTIKI